MFFVALPSTSDGDSTILEDDQPLKIKMKLTLKKKEDPLKLFMKEMKDAVEERGFNRMHNESLKAKRELTNVFSDKMDALISLFKKDK
jgi:hypothetical protein